MASRLFSLISYLLAQFNLAFPIPPLDSLALFFIFNMYSAVCCARRDSTHRFTIKERKFPAMMPTVLSSLEEMPLEESYSSVASLEEWCVDVESSNQPSSVQETKDSFDAQRCSFVSYVSRNCIPWQMYA